MLQNRVTPCGDIVALDQRGLLMGNRGGRLHDPETKTLGRRRWVSRRWISCRLTFRDRRREVMGRGYTELFFLDEVTALAAGHRPCFECRHEAATAFGEAWRRALGGTAPPRADAIDAVLHTERTQQRCRREPRPLAELPDGTIVAFPHGRAEASGEPACWAVRGDDLLRWGRDGYRDRQPRPADALAVPVTPPAMIALLGAGYTPIWHPTACG